MTKTSIKGNLVDIPARRMYAAEVVIEDGRIARISELSEPVQGFILPGFVDAHVHVESSMLIPSEFARLAVTHGTVATVSDPHEIGNVLGVEGVEFMIANGKKTPFHFYFGAPSCVPATVFETAGDAIDAAQVGALLEKPEVLYLSEMMNFPGVLHGDAEVMKKIAHAHRLGKPVDGHAPGLRGEDARRYIAAGISTDHECFTSEEAQDKLKHGMKILIREGSAAKNFEALIDLLRDHPDEMMFCSDDKHPDSLVENHINVLCVRAVAKGIDIYNVLQAACVNPVEHYKLPIGRLCEGDPADLIVVEDLVNFRVRCTYLDGVLVAENGKSLIPSVKEERPNRFHCTTKTPQDFAVPATNDELLVITALDGQLITGKELMPGKVENDQFMADPSRDLLKIAVVNRYKDTKPAIGWIKNFGLKRGAIAGSVAHDSHNIVAVGTNDDDLCKAINLVIEARGGVSLADGDTKNILPLPVAGIMTDADAYEVAQAYSKIDAQAKVLGSMLGAPYMTLSFMALLVIPHLKMSDLGLFDGDAFRLV
ncbi:MAG: adenine deaminase [Flavobacteriales bacterium]|jgi:adenine deaminase|nr:adenine deaminase [Flavobacteriales bacterium]MBK6892558.1 adenine deaminase [Flavobacteriales bacterium]MBK7246692.1 adenine deaminase [Flavobacteriales bacterium]MBK9060950.1 adenine deaminase [Flavobacteriales bacterium]MBK9598656.1 adenine deaminase [Flavobacteriales bacterium]